MRHPSELLNFERARRAVADVALVTPLLEVPELSERLGRPVLLKLENLQVTGSFKVRGAASRLAALTREERRRGVVACSSGNHGRAVAYVAERLGIPAIVCVPEWVDPVKLAGIRRHGAETVLAGPTFDEAEAHALELARTGDRVYVSAYDDPRVIAGQGTLALEVLDALDVAPAAFLVPLSGGGLAGGIAAGLRSRLGTDAPSTVAVTAERAPVMLRSLEIGHPVELPGEATLANALSGGIGLDNRHSFPLVRDLVARHVVVTEDDIAMAMAFAFSELHVIVEGGGAVGLAALLRGGWHDGALPRERPVVVIVSGGNVDLATLSGVLRRSPPDRS